jgi:hypothetical protein
MNLERFEMNFYAALARNELLKRRGRAFQDFFIEVGHYLWAPDCHLNWMDKVKLGKLCCDFFRAAGRMHSSKQLSLFGYPGCQ